MKLRVFYVIAAAFVCACGQPPVSANPAAASDDAQADAGELADTEAPEDTQQTDAAPKVDSADVPAAPDVAADAVDSAHVDAVGTDAAALDAGADVAADLVVADVPALVDVVGVEVVAADAILPGTDAIFVDTGPADAGTLDAGSPGTDAVAVDSGPTDVGTPDTGPPQQLTVFTILLENHTYADIVGGSNAPYLNSLIGKYGLATNYKDSGTHPSLPNYLYLTSGKTQYLGLFDYDPTSTTVDLVSFPVAADNLGNQLEAKGIPWRSYQESAGGTCKLSGNGDYAPKHNPFLYYSGIQKDPNGLCDKRNVDYTEFPADLASGKYRYMWITPNLTSDGHNPTTDPPKALKQCDDWMAKEVPKILASDAYKNGGILFITWDEGEGLPLIGDIDHVPMIVVTEKIVKPGYQSATALSHASYLATVEDLFGLPRLGAAIGASTLMEFWKP